ncbi:VWA domain-containing protein [Leptospira levettii]|uniref:VWA domain-containing protein n=2 Tax=Leptospira levettii TaxID=2023178 RepID=UPI000C2AD7CD|nr:VWA domain-containing protein [Leptospira levettii]PJZ38634.1 VWA domain-containing protein [Leptospira levettii]PKA01968.1 VWA domain-containing protein [Leptospira levettii]
MVMFLEAKLEYPIILEREIQENHLLLRFRTPANPKVEDRKPLVIGLAIDKSWSMKGEKMEAVIDASCALVNWLTRHDAVSIVAYSSDVQLIQPVTHLTEKVSVTDKIRNIQVATSTNLSGGWLSALKSLTQSKIPNAYKRVLLLTDGNPTSGLKEKDALVGIASDHLAMGISTTTIGVGNDFNEEMLVEIAKAGGGNFHYIDNPENASDIFFEEFGDIGALYAQAIDVELQLAPGVRLKQVLSETTHQVFEEFDEFLGDAKTISRQKINLQLGDLRADDLRNLVLRLEIDDRVHKTETPFCEVNVSYYNLLKQNHLENVKESFSFERGNNRGKQDPDVLVEILIANATLGIKEITEFVKREQIEDAKTMLFGLIQDIKNNLHFAPNALGSLLNRLLVLESKMATKSDDLHKHLFMNSQILARGTDKIDLKDVVVHDQIFEYQTVGDIDLYKCPEIKQLMEQKIADGYRYMIFDFSRTSHIDSSAIGMVIQIVGWLRRRGGELVVTNIRDSVKKIFEITRLYNHIRVAENLPSAKEILQRIVYANEGDQII